MSVRKFSIDHLHVEVHPTRAELGRAAGAAAAKAIQSVVENHGSARIILASAPSQNELLDTLCVSSVEWSRVEILHMDEYVGIPENHPATFRTYQREHVLSRIRPAAFYGIEGENENPGAACAKYTNILTDRTIDVVCLGIGENGHIAFNDPPVADFTDAQLVKIVELDPACRQQQVNDGCFASIDAVPRRAITLTIPALTLCRAMFCAVPGPRKAVAVRDTLTGPIETACPASILRTHGNATLYLDVDSASLVP
jgi:glucosamine-6-phosphate deaminase